MKKLSAKLMAENYGAHTPEFSKMTPPPAPVKLPGWPTPPGPSAVERMIKTPYGWVEINGTHVNTALVSTFFWNQLKGLTLFYIGSDRPTVWHDPDKALYRKLCDAVGIEPAGGGDHVL